MNSRSIVSGACGTLIKGERHPSSVRPRCVRISQPLYILPAVLVFTLSAWAAKENAAMSADEKAIRDSADAFTEAFNRGDAKAVADLWTPDGSFIDSSGMVLKGRKAIEEAYAKYFEQRPGNRIEIHITNIEFPADGVAIEDGTSKSFDKEGGPPSSDRYTVTHIKKDGKWLMASVRTIPDEEADAARSPLADLQWLVGKWQVKVGNKVLHSDLRWIAKDKFIERDYTVDQDGVTTASGKQIIGWDPQAGQIRSWTFDSTGGHGTGLWSPDPEGWSIDTVGMLADGTPTASHDFLIHVPGEERVVGWRSTDRTVGNMPLPDVPEVVLDRVGD